MVLQNSGGSTKKGLVSVILFSKEMMLVLQSRTGHQFSTKGHKFDLEQQSKNLDFNKFY